MNDPTCLVLVRHDGGGVYSGKFVEEGTYVVWRFPGENGLVKSEVARFGSAEEAELWIAAAGLKKGWRPLPPMVSMWTDGRGQGECWYLVPR